jgi:nicotinamidase-related amidase
MTDSRTALLLIDIQQGMDSPSFGKRNNLDAERKAAALLAAWRAAGAPIVHIQHLSVRPDSVFRPGQPGAELKEDVRPAPGEPLFQKRANCAFIGTTLETHLRQCGISHLVVAGMMTDHCVSATARVAADLGFAVTVVSDATATFERAGPDGRQYDADEIHRVELASLNREFATIRTANEVLSIATGAEETRQVR